MPPDCDDDVAARLGELERNLLSARAGADDEDAFARYVARAAVLGGMQGDNAGRRRERDVRLRGVTGGKHDVPGCQDAAARVDPEAAAVGLDELDIDAGCDGSRERASVCLQIVDELRAVEEPVLVGVRRCTGK